MYIKFDFGLISKLRTSKFTIDLGFRANYVYHRHHNCYSPQDILGEGFIHYSAQK